MKYLILILFAALAGYGLAGENNEIDGVFESKINAIQNNDYQSFISNSTNEFSDTLKKPQFTDVSWTFGKNLAAGYTKDYQGKYQQKGLDIHLYKISYKNGAPENLYKMVMQGDKLAGFWIQ